MNTRPSRLLSPRRIAITASVVLGVIQVILLGAAYQRQVAAEQLAAEKTSLEENIAQMRQINQDELDALQADLEGIQNEILILENSFPELGAPFALYNQILDLSETSQVELQEVSLVGVETFDTYAGTVLEKNYSLTSLGDLADCLAFIKQLEDAGQNTLSLELITIQPDMLVCDLDLRALGYPAANP